ncbi:MAG TPA: helix-turn-helix transcriptional regulator [Polyangia bacterium]|nr:helix-turn-helix transcriptional regulator [Polyangia bacterium]
MRKTGFDRYFDKRMKDKTFAAEYVAARAEIDSVDDLMRQLEAARVQKGLTKAEVARRAGTTPEVVRRLFTMESPNPTMSTVVSVARTMGLAIALVPSSQGSPPRKARKAA